MKLLISQKEGRNEHGVKMDSLELEYVKFFNKEGFEVIPVPNDLEAVDKLLYGTDALVLSGGGDINKQLNRNAVERKMIKYSIETDTPLLGICRGMQQINRFFGGQLSPNTRYPEVRKHSLIITDSSLVSVLERGRGPVNSYHNFAITEKGLAKSLKAFGISNYGLIEGFYHPKLSIAGIQWHPERMKGISYWIDKHVIDILKGN